MNREEEAQRLFSQLSHVPPAAVDSDVAVPTLVPIVQYMPMMTMFRPNKVFAEPEAPSKTVNDDMSSAMQIKRISREAAAIKIQRKYRLYSYKKLFAEREINPVIKYHFPDIYFTALIIKEVVIVLISSNSRILCKI
jgi:hypothetical protein